MARKPARLERAGALTPRDRMWASIRALAVDDADVEAWFSAAEVHFLANTLGGAPAHIDSVISYLVGLSRAEPAFVELADGDRPAGRKRAALSLYRLVRDTGVDAPRVTTEGKPVTTGETNEQLWSAMKALRDFDCAALMQAVRDAGGQVSIRTVKTYVTFLTRAGYLAIAAASKPGTQARYRFNRARNTGPRAPLITRAKEVMDANTGEIVWPEGAAK